MVTRPNQGSGIREPIAASEGGCRENLHRHFALLLDVSALGCIRSCDKHTLLVDKIAQPSYKVKIPRRGVDLPESNSVPAAARIAVGGRRSRLRRYRAALPERPTVIGRARGLRTGTRCRCC